MFTRPGNPPRAQWNEPSETDQAGLPGASLLIIWLVVNIPRKAVNMVKTHYDSPLLTIVKPLLNHY